MQFFALVLFSTQCLPKIRFVTMPRRDWQISRRFASNSLVSEVVGKKITPKLSTIHLQLHLLKWSNRTLPSFPGRCQTRKIHGLTFLHFIPCSTSLIKRMPKWPSSTAESALGPLTHIVQLHFMRWAIFF